MIIKCLKENLSYGLQNVQRAISLKKTIPILEGVLIKAIDNHLIITATDLELGIETRIPAEVIEEGEIVVTSGKFIELIKKLPNINIDLQKKGNNLNIKYLNSEVEIMGFNTEEFPLLPTITDEFNFSIKALNLNSLIRKTIFASSPDESRPVFNGTLLNISDKTIKMITTDSHRLAINNLKIDNESDNINIIIPRKTLNEIQKIFKDEEEIINIYGNENQVCFQNSDTKIISRIIDGKFPNFEQVIPKNYQTTMKLNKKDFLDTIERASLFVDSIDNVSIVKLKITDSNINITSKSESGNLNENLNAYIEGDNLEISFNSKYLIEALKIIDTKDIEFKFSGNLSPAIIKENNESYIYLVLPLRTN